MKKAIITGANGFIGNAVTRLLLEKGVQVVSFGKTEPLIQSQYLDFVPMELSIVSETKSDKLKDADIFYHFAWQGSSGNERCDTNLQLRNAQWTIDCLRLAKQAGCKRFVSAGTIMERETLAAALEPGGRPGLAYIYGSGKLVAHTMCMSVAADIGIELIWTLITNAYGAGETSPRFINTTIRKIINGETLKFTSGTQNYDFVYITDAADAFYMIGENGIAFNEYLIGSGTARPLKEFILEMIKTIAPDHHYIFGDVPYTGVNMPLSLFDCTRTEHDTGFKASVSFSEGIRKTYDWIRKDFK